MRQLLRRYSRHFILFKETLRKTCSSFSRSLLCCLALVGAALLWPGEQASAQSNVALKTDWQRSTCYSGLDYRLVLFKPSLKSSEIQMVRLYIRNRYRKRVWLSYNYTVNGQELKGRTNVGAGAVFSGGAWTTVPRTNRLRGNGRFEEVKFDGSWGGPYHNCDR